jgi:hypothetical protein
MSTTTERAATNGPRPLTPYSPPRPPRRHRDTDTGDYWAGVALLLGILVTVLGFVAVWMGFSAHDARAPLSMMSVTSTLVLLMALRN